MCWRVKITAMVEWRRPVINCERAALTSGQQVAAQETQRYVDFRNATKTTCIYTTELILTSGNSCMGESV